jgi:hypothetical protein
MLAVLYLKEKKYLYKYKVSNRNIFNLYIHTWFISSLPFCSPGRRLRTFPTTNLMDFALMGLEWEYIAEYFTTYITSIFPFGTTSLVRLDVVV